MKNKMPNTMKNSGRESNQEVLEQVNKTFEFVNNHLLCVLKKLESNDIELEDFLRISKTLLESLNEIYDISKNQKNKNYSEKKSQEFKSYEKIEKEIETKKEIIYLKINNCLKLQIKMIEQNIINLTEENPNNNLELNTDKLKRFINILTTEICRQDNAEHPNLELIVNTYIILTNKMEIYQKQIEKNMKKRKELTASEILAVLADKEAVESLPAENLCEILIKLVEQNNPEITKAMIKTGFINGRKNKNRKECSL